MEPTLKEIDILFDEMAIANTSKRNNLKIKKLEFQYVKAFQLANKKEFDKAKNILHKADNFLHDHFKEGSFEYYFSQLFAIQSKSYLEFKIKNKSQAILLTKKGIEYAILLQDYLSSYNIMSIFISMMLKNLAKIHLLNNEIKEWHDITLENIHFYLNFSMPRNCQGFDMSGFKKTPLHLRYYVLTTIITDALNNIVKFKVKNGQDLIESIIIEDKSDYFIGLIDSWIKLNVYINKRQTGTDKFNEAYNNFLESKHHKCDLQNLKRFLKYRIKEEGIQLHELI